MKAWKLNKLGPGRRLGLPYLGVLPSISSLPGNVLPGETFPACTGLVFSLPCGSRAEARGELRGVDCWLEKLSESEVLEVV